MTTYDYLMCCLDLAHNLHFRGYLARAVEWAELGRARLTTHIPIITACTLGATLAGVGRFGESRKHLELCRDSYHSTTVASRKSAYLVAGLHAALEAGELGQEADLLIEQFHQLGFNLWSAPFHIRYFYILEAHVRLRQCLTGADKRLEFKRALNRLRLAVNLPGLSGHIFLLDAAQAWLNRDLKTSQRKLTQA